MIVLKALAALAQKSRLAIFRHLVEVGPGGAFAGDIAEALGISAAMLSFHLKELNNAGLVESEQQGRFVRYAANFATMNGLIAYLTENCCGGVPQKCVTECVPVAKKSPRRRAAR